MKNHYFWTRPTINQYFKSETISRPGKACDGARCGQVRPHWHRYPLGVRLSDALRPFGRFSPSYDQKTTSQVNNIRTAVVFARGHQHRLPEGTRSEDMGRMGRRRRKSRPCVRRPVAFVAFSRRTCDRPDIRSRTPDTSNSRFAPDDRIGMERRTVGQNGPYAMSCAVPVLCV